MLACEAETAAKGRIHRLAPEAAMIGSTRPSSNHHGKLTRLQTEIAKQIGERKTKAKAKAQAG